MQTHTLAFLCAIALLAGAAIGQTPVGTAFTFQGRLTNAGSPATGPHDVQFKLFNVAAGVGQVGSTICVDGMSPNPDGTFTTTLDFGPVATGQALWIELAVRPDATPGNCGGGVYTTLTPRQRLTPAPYAMGLALPLAESQALNTFGASLFSITNLSTLNATYAIYGQSNATNPDAAGVYGYAPGPTGAVSGVKGLTGSAGGYGVSGGALNSSPGASSIGVFGLSASPLGSAVFAHANNATGNNQGVEAWAAGTGGTGVLALAYSPTGFTTGVSAEAASGDGIAINAYASSNSGTPIGVRAVTRAPNAIAVQAQCDATSGTSVGVIAAVNSPDGIPIQGDHVAATGSLPAIRGNTLSASANAVGVLGTVIPTSPGAYSAGVSGVNNGTGGNGVGVWGSQNGSGYGVYGTTPNGWAVRGEASGATGVNYGVYGSSSSPGGYAGYFPQKVYVGGDLTHKYTPAGPEERMSPIAYGDVAASGALLQGTSNLTSSLLGSVYNITIAGETYQFQSYVTIVTPATSTVPVIATTGSGGGQLHVRLFNLAGANTTGDFHFVVFKR